MTASQPSEDAISTGSNKASNKSIEAQDHNEKIPYPKSVFFIVSNEFCERFCYYGMRTVLTLYLTDILLFNESDATIIYHAFTMFVYFFPVFGAMLADSLLGKFNTIFYVSMIYAVGNAVLALSAIEPLNLPDRGFSILGLLLIALGTGGIKPCVSAFGGDQFILPQQELQLASFFSMFYFSINAGSLISTSVTPILREKVHCFGEESCFSLAFGVPGILMVVSIIIFGLGKPLYRIKKPEGNVVIEVSKCISTAIKEKSKSKDEKKEHWLDYAEEKHGTKLVEDIKSTLKVLVLYIPLPVFWALFDQQGSGWTFQARRMDGDIGFYTILPDQMQVVNPLLILAFIPLFQYCIYPALNKCHVLKTPLQRIVTGGVLAAVAFLISACISLALESTYPVLPSEGNGQIRIYNTLPCDISVNAPELSSDFTISRGDYYRNIDITLEGNKSYSYSITSNCRNVAGSFEVYEGYSAGYFINASDMVYFDDDVAKHDKGLPKIRTLIDLNTNTYATVTYVNDEGETKISTNTSDTSFYELNPGTYTINIGNFSTSTRIYLGGVYAVLAAGVNNSYYETNVLEVTPPNSIHMLLLLPQYLIITMGEIMFSITGLEFSYSQAPSSMKAVLTACWLLTTAFGNLIVVLIEVIGSFEKQSHNFFLYAALMGVDMVIFALMAMRYKYVVKEESSVEMESEGAVENGVDNPNFKKHSAD